MFNTFWSLWLQKTHKINENYIITFYFLFLTGDFTKNRFLSFSRSNFTLLFIIMCGLLKRKIKLFSQAWMCLFIQLFVYGFGPNLQNCRRRAIFLHKTFFYKVKWKHPLISAVQDQACYRNSLSNCNISNTCCLQESSAFPSLLSQYILGPSQIVLLFCNYRREISQELRVEK